MWAMPRGFFYQEQPLDLFHSVSQSYHEAFCLASASALEPSASPCLLLPTYLAMSHANMSRFKTSILPGWGEGWGEG